MMSNIPMNNPANSASRKAWSDGPYIPIFECRTGSHSQLLDNQSPPPRPPKPSSWKMRSKSESCSSLPSCSFTDNNKVNSFNDGQSDRNNSNLEFAYDFPKAIAPAFNLRTHMPARNSSKFTLSYDNGVHVCRNKAEIFTYDYHKPVLPNFSDGGHLTFEVETLDRSPQPSTPNSAHESLSSNGSYSKSSTPPAVNRGLKPRRKGSDSDMNSPASPTFKLSPPPPKSNYSIAQTRPPQSVKARIEPPPVPSRSRQSLSNRDSVAFNDDGVNFSPAVSRRNLSHDDQSIRSHSVPRKPCDPNSVTYLDLDLEKDSKSSSQKPSAFNQSHFYSTSSLKNHHHTDNQPSNVNLSKPTIYKTIDFVATDAIRKLKIGLEDSHRNS